jgi:hypothetical protein
MVNISKKKIKKEKILLFTSKIFSLFFFLFLFLIKEIFSYIFFIYYS